MNNGIIVLKFFLHVSREVQKKRFIERVNEPEKHWKFSAKDIGEMKYRDAYMAAYQDMFNATSTPHAPWYIIPADHKWFTHLAVTSVISDTLDRLRLSYPSVSSEDMKALLAAKKEMEQEDNGPGDPGQEQEKNEQRHVIAQLNKETFIKIRIQMLPGEGSWRSSKGISYGCQRQQIGQAGAMLTRAFFDDPKLTHLIPDIAAKKELSRYLFEFELQYGMNYGDVYTTSPAVEGVAVWLPSTKSEVTFWRAFRSGGMVLQKHLGKQIMDRLMSFSTAVDILHKKHAPYPHYYLFFIGVDPAYQKKRVASRLITPMLGWLDMQKLPCYLNTQNENNIGLYEHYGFQVIEQLVLPDSGIVHTAMQRNPR